MFTFHRNQTISQSTWQIPDPEDGLRRRQRRLAIFYGWATFTFVVTAAIGVGFPTAPIYEFDAYGCFTEKSPAQAVEFLIDQSDPFSSAQLALFTNKVRHYARDLAVGNLLSLFKLEPNQNGQPLTETFSRCRPPEGKDVSRMTDNRDFRDNDYREQFAIPLEDALNSVIVPSKANNSPLLESLYLISQRPSFDNGGQGRTLVYFGDGLQHTSLATFFKRGYGFERLSQRNSVYLSGLHERFQGACVEMNIVSSKYPRQTAWPEFETFWRDYWQAAGVDCLKIKRI